MTDNKDLLDATSKLACSDNILGELIRKVGPITLQPQLSQTAYQALIRSVVYQQLTSKAANEVFG